MEVWEAGGGETDHERVWEKPSETRDEGDVPDGEGVKHLKGWKKEQTRESTLSSHTVDIYRTSTKY